MHRGTRLGLNRARSRARIATVAALAVVASAFSATTTGAAVAAPAAPAAAAAAAAPDCVDIDSTTFTNNTPVRIPLDPAQSSGLTTSTVSVNNAGPVLIDLDVMTDITHTFASDIEMTLQSPAGTIVTLTTDNGGGADDVFAGTTWDDDADPGSPLPYNPLDPVNIATDHTYANNVLASNLVPEEALSAFNREDPNGTWILTINDDAAADTGMLNSWSLRLITRMADETHRSEPRASDTTSRGISDAAPTTSTINVQNAGSKISDVDVGLLIDHTLSEDLLMSLTSPEGTVVTLSTGNGNGANNFAGTFFDDNADPGSQVPYTLPVMIVSDHTFTSGVSPGRLVPEEAMGAFIGENPNGTWTLRILDTNANGQNGTLNGWVLEITTSFCDTTVSGVKAKYSSKLKNKKYLYIRVRVGEPAEIRIAGKAKGRKGGYAKFKTTTKAAKPGRYVPFKIRLSKKASKATKRRKGRAKVFIRVTDDVGNVKKLRKTVRYYR